MYVIRFIIPLQNQRNSKGENIISIVNQKTLHADDSGLIIIKYWKLTTGKSCGKSVTIYLLLLYKDSSHLLTFITHTPFLWPFF